MVPFTIDSQASIIGNFPDLDVIESYANMKNKK